MVSAMTVKGGPTIKTALITDPAMLMQICHGR